MENPNKSSFLWYYVGGPGVAGLGYLIYELFKDEENGNLLRQNNNSKIFCSILIIKRNHWFVLQASSPLTNKLQTNNDLWNRIYPIVKTFESD